MRGRRTSVALVVVPVLAYLTLLALVASLYVHPPLRGWIGYAVVCLVGIVVATGATVLFPRMRTNVDVPDEPDPGRLLVLADADCAAEDVTNEIAARVAETGAAVLVVAPVLASPLHYLTGEEESERSVAEARLGALLTNLHSRGIHADGRLGDDDPLQALGDALALFPAGEALLVTTDRHWLEPGFVERAKRLVPELELVHAV